MKVILIDDDESMLIIMRKMLDNISDIQILGAFQCLKEAENFLKSDNIIDIIFIDINMPEENGIDFTKRVLKDRETTKIIFITSHKEYALDAFEVYAFDYIVKPVNRERLTESINKIRKKSDTVKNVDLLDTEDYLITISCFGGLEIRSSDGKVIKLPSSKCEELISYLLLNRGKYVSKWRIIEDLFSGMEISNAEIYLNTTIYKLRKTLQPYGLKEAIKNSNQSYKLDISSIYVDFIEFENKVNSLYNKKLTTMNAIEVENMYTGDLLGDKEYCWSLPEKERLTTIYCNYAKELCIRLMEENNYYLALTILKKLEKTDEFDEEINCLLMQVYVAKNDKSALMKQFKLYQERLKKELGVAPTNKTINLYKKLLRDIN